MGGAVKTVKQTFSNPIRGLTAVGTFGTSELARKMGGLPGQVAKLPERASDAVLGTNYSNAQGPTGAKGSPIYGYGLDPLGDQGQINALGNINQADNQSLLDRNYASFGNDQDAIKQTGAEDLAARAAARDKLAGLLQEQARQTFSQSLPGTAEDYNAGGLLNSTGYQQEVARQQGQLASGITNQLQQAGLRDVDLGSQYLQQGLGSRLDADGYMRQGLASNQAALQQARQAALQRQFSVKDFGNAADTASIIGAQNAPQVGNGKAGTGAMLSGAGSLASGLGGLK